MSLDRTSMHGHAEPVLNARDQFGDGQRGQAGALLQHKFQDRRRKFVRAVRAAFARNQAREALLRNGMLGLIESRPRQAESRRSFGNGVLSISTRRSISYLT